MGRQASRNRQLLNRAAPFLVAALAGGVLFYVRGAHQTANAMEFIMTAGEGAPIFHPHHLMQSTVILLLHKMLGPVGCGAVCAGQLHSIVWASIGLGATFYLGRTLFRSNAAGLLLATMVLVAHSFWVYASQAETYVPTLGATVAIAAILVRREKVELGPLQVIGAAALLLLAIGYHQSSVLFAMPVLLYLPLRDGKRGFLQALAITALAAILTLVGYVAAFYLSSDARSLGDFMRWVLLYGTLPENHGLFSHFGPVGLSQFVSSQTTVFLVLPEFFGTQRFAIWFVFPIIVLTVLWNGIAIHRRSVDTPERAFFLTWYALYALFFIWWGPFVSKFFISTIVPFVFLASFATRDLVVSRVESEPWTRFRREAVMLMVGGIIAVLAVSNLESVLYVHREVDPHHAMAAELVEVVPEECRIVIQDGRGALYLQGRGSVNVKQVYYRYFDYAGAGLESSSMFEDTDCVAMPIGHASVERFADRATRGDSPLTAEDWVPYVKWLFAVEPVGGDSVRHRSVDVLPRKEKAALLVIRDTRVTADGTPDDFVEDVEGLVERETAGYGDVSPDGIAWRVIEKRLRIFGY